LQHQVLTPLDASLSGRGIIVCLTNLPLSSSGAGRCPCALQHQVLAFLDASLIGRVIIVCSTDCRPRVAAGVLFLALHHQVLTPLDVSLTAA
jgi:hypothetical protein